MKGRHVLITGGTGALGSAVTMLALARGGDVTVPYISEAEQQRLRERVGANESLRLVQADLGDEASVALLIGDMPRLDVLIHLVGGFDMGPTEATSLESWRQQMDLSLTTTFLCAKHALARMKQTGYGRIVTIGSKAVLEPAAQTAAYSAAKAGVVALTRVIAAETKGSDITANCVLPSVIDTPANRASMGTAQAGTWVKPESLAEVIAFLGSDAARDVRGAAIPVFGNV